MKKTVSFTLALLLAFALTATTAFAEQTERVIKPSELIALEDAGRILGTEMETDRNFSDSAESFGSLRTVYNAEGYMLQITIRQDAQLDENDPADMEYLARGSISTTIMGIRGTYENAEGTIQIKNLGDWAGIVKPVGTLYSLYIVYGDSYFIEISLSGEGKGDDWEIGKLKEAGQLAAKRLETISGVKSAPGNNGGFNWLWFLLIALAVVSVGGGVAFIIMRKKGKIISDKVSENISEEKQK